MTGRSLVARVREIDRELHRHTHVVALGDEDTAEATREAFQGGVDDFLYKSNVRTDLLGRVLAASRSVQRTREIVSRVARLEKRLQQIDASLLIDPLTGLGNQRMTINALQDTLKQVESRGGAACLLMVGIVNLDHIRAEYDEGTAAEVVQGFARRLRQLVRPLDVVTHTRAATFGVVMCQTDIDNCAAASFRRVYDSLNQRSFPTERGFVPVRIGMSLIACDTNTGLPDAAEMLKSGIGLLAEAIDSGVIAVKRWRA